MVNVSLFVNLTGQWQLLNSTLINALPSHQRVEFTGHTFTCENIGVKDVMFVAVDEFNYSSNSTATMRIDKDDVTISFVSPYSFTLSREGNENATLGIYVYDTDRNNIPIIANIAYYVTSDGENYTKAGQNQSDSSGYSMFVFDPNCSYNVGIQSWQAGTIDNMCYKDINGSIPGAKITIIGQLKNSLVEPAYGSIIEIEVGKTVNVTSSIKGECGENVEGASVTHEARWPDSTFENIVPVEELGLGLYNSTWNITFKKGGYYGFRINSSKEYYYPNSSLFADWVYLNNTPPLVENFSVTPSSAGWGNNFTFSADIFDTQLDNVTCKLFTFTPSSSSWVYRGSTTVYNGRGNCTITVSNFNCQDVNYTLNWFKFEINDGTNVFNTSNISAPNIEKDPVEIEYVYGNDSIANRSMYQKDLLVLRIKDTIKNSYVGSNVQGRIFVTKDGINYDSGTQNTTNSTGYLNVYFDPQSDYDVGPQYWKGGTYQDSCYLDSNSTEFILTIYGDLSNSLLIPETYTEYLKPEENISIRAKVEDDNYVAVSDAWLNITLIHGLQEFECSPVYPMGNGEYNCTINTSTLPAGMYNVSIASNKTYYNDGYYLKENALFIKTKPILYGENVSSQQASSLGGWGEVWTFKVNVTDEDLDNVTVYLYIKWENDSSWTLANVSDYETNPELQGPLNASVTLTYSNPGLFQSKHGNWSYKFVAEDSRGYQTETSPRNFTIEKDDVIIEVWTGNGEIVWRNGTQILYLRVNVTDIDRNLPAENANVTFWITLDGENFDSGTSTLSNSNGVAEYPFDPGCPYSVGVQKWKAGIVYDPLFKEFTTQNFTLTIKTLMQLNITYPDRQSFLIGEKVPFIGYIYDECSEGIPGATVTFKDKRGFTEYSCSPVSDLGNGTYNCTFDTSGKAYGWHDVVMTALKQYYENYPSSSTITKTNAYFLASQPSLSGLSVNKNFGGWGELYTFTVMITDPDSNYNNVTLWKSLDNQTWSLVNWTWVKVSYSNMPVSFSVRFTCEDYLNGENGKLYYKINTTDEYGYKATTEVKNITLERDDVYLSIGADSNSSVRRIGNNFAYLEFRIYDTDYQNYPSNANGTIWVTKDGSNFSVAYECTSSQGYCSALHNPDCDSSVGIQYWKGGIIEKDGFSCYQVINSSVFNFTVYGQLNISIISPEQGKILNRGKTHSFNASVRNDCGEEVNDANINWYNSSWHFLASGYDTSWLVPITYKLGPETIYSNVSRQYYDGNYNFSSVYIYGWSEIDSISPANSSSYAAGTPITITCHVRDSNTSQPIPNYTVSFLKNGESLENASTNSQGYASIVWYTNLEGAGWYNLTCFIESNSTLYYNATLAQMETWIRLSRPLQIDQIIPQYPWVYRNDSFTPYQTNISVHVRDAQIGHASNANVSFYNSTHFLFSCLTNSTGWCELIDFNPPDDYTPSPYWIYINATRPGNEDSLTNSTSITVKGILFVNITSPLNESLHPKSEAIDLSATVISENGENSSVLNPTVKWYNETALLAVGLEVTLPQPIVAQQRTGPHQLMAIASKSYYEDGKSNVSIIITGLADVVWVSPIGITPYPEEFYPTCLVKDHESGAGISDYEVNFSYKWEPSSEFIFNGSYTTNSSGYASYVFIPTQKGNITFNCSIGENATQYYSPNIKEAIETIWVKDISLPKIFNFSVIPNSSIEANLNLTYINATIIDNYGIESVWANITLPNGSIVIVPMSNISVPETGFGFFRATYSASYLPPIGGEYNISVYARDYPPESNVNSTFVGNISVWGKISGLVEQLPAYVVAYNITQTQGFTFEVSVNFTNLGPATAYSVNLTHAEDPLGSLTYNESRKECGTVYAGQTCSWVFKITVPEKTSPQLIRAYTIATWQNPDKTVEQKLNETSITVSSNPVIEVIPKSINKTTPHDLTTYIGNITTYASGNDEVRDVSISTVGGNLAFDCPLCVLSIIPNSYGLLPAGESFVSDITITVPAGQAPGIYWTKVRASSSNAGYDEMLLNLTIPINTSWIRSPESFGYVLLPLNTSGTIGNIT
ncbi:MAG: hypothetical protein QW403_02665, partial [Candidatus Aenigmatarchaeota archaeon]